MKASIMLPDQKIHEWWLGRKSSAFFKEHKHVGVSTTHTYQNTRQAMVKWFTIKSLFNDLNNMKK